MAAPPPAQAPPTFAPKMPPGTKGTPIDVATNCYPLALQANTPYFLYDFRINAVFKNAKGEEKLKEVTKQSREDFDQTDRKAIAVHVFKHLVKSQLKGKAFIYDRAALLIAMEKIADVTKNGTAKYTVAVNSIPSLKEPRSLLKEALELRVEIKAAETFQVTSNDLKGNIFGADDKGLLEVLNLATSQKLFMEDAKFVVYGNGNAYLKDARAELYDPASRSTIADKYMGTGMSKGVKTVEASSGQGVQAVVSVDVKKTAFHNSWERLDKKMESLIRGLGVQPTLQNFQMKKFDINRLLKDLACVTEYTGNQGAKRIGVRVGVIGTESATAATFKDKNGRAVKISQYIKDVHKTQLTNNMCPIVIDSRTKMAFAPECLLVAPNQRVKTDQAQSGVIDSLIKESAILPSERKKQTAAMKDNLQLKAPEMASFGVKTAAEPLTVKARVLPPVNLLGGNMSKFVSNAGKIPDHAVVKAVDLNNWWLVCTNQGDNVDLRALGSNLVLAAKKKGAKFANPHIDSVFIDQRFDDGFDDLLQKAKSAGAQLVMVVSERRVKNHDKLKAAEQRVGIVTEQILSQNAQKASQAGGSAQTLENIVRKMIEKTGGQDVAVNPGGDVPAWLFGQDCMILSFVMEHAKPTGKQDMKDGVPPARPSIIGYSVNAVTGANQASPAEATHFSGGYIFSNPREYGAAAQPAYGETIGQLLKDVITKYRAIRGKPPLKIILFVGGVAEGDFDKMINEEMKVIRGGFDKLSTSFNPTLVVISANLSHSDRFYRANMANLPKGRNMAQIENLPSGTVIDRGVTNPLRNEMFIQSHVPLQGTAKVPQYVKLLDMKGAMNNDQMQAMLFALTHVHGICNLTTAIPTPVYVASECLKRAKAQLANFERSGGQWSVETLNKEVAIGPEHTLAFTRFNA